MQQNWTYYSNIIFNAYVYSGIQKKVYLYFVFFCIALKGVDK